MKNQWTYRVLFTATLVLLMYGCGITRKYQTPAIDVRAEEQLFREHITGDSTGIADLPWQELFRDPALQSLISEGLEHNYDLQAALQRIAEAQAVFRQSRQNMLPSLNINPNVTYNHQSKAALNLPPNININLRTTTVQLPIGASWELDVWGKLASTKRSALAKALQSEAAAQAVRTQLIAAIATHYYQLLALDEQRKITQATVVLRQKDVETLEAMKEASLVDGAALAQTEAGMQAARITLIELEQSIRERENALSVLAGRVPGSIARNTLDSQQPAPLLRTGIPVAAVLNRPDVAAAEMAFRASFENVNAARASFYPSFTLSARSGLSALTTNDLFTNSLFTTVTGGLLQPIYNNGINKMNLRRAEAQQWQAYYAFQQSVLVAGQEVSDALYSYEISQQKDSIRVLQITALEQSVDYTKELLQYSPTTNYLDVITAEQGLLSAQLAGVNDRLQRLLAVVQLYRALGGGRD